MEHVAGVVVGSDNPELPEEVKAFAEEVAKAVAKNLPSRPKRPHGTYGQMKEIAQRYFDNEQFKMGDVVQWKEGMKNADIPAYGEPVAVLEVAPGQRSGGDSSTSSHFYEPCDIRLGVLMAADYMQAFWYDAKRFERVAPTPVESGEPDICQATSMPMTVA